MSRRALTFLATYRKWFFAVAIALMTYAAVTRLVPEFEQLVRGSNAAGAAVDLRAFHRIVNLWFAGDKTVGTQFIVYPPASLIMLWPFVGWVDFESARLLAAIANGVVVVAFAALLAREAGARDPFAVAFVLLLVLSTKATGQTIGNGQITLYTIASLTAGLIILGREPRGVAWDLLGSALVLFSLVKPNVSAPFFWIVLFAPRRRWPALLVVAGYALITLFALHLADRSLWEVARTWAASSGKTAARAGNGNVSRWLAMGGLHRFVVATNIATLLALGGWLAWCRKADLWLRIGATAAFTRLWTYHYFYDDVLLLLPMIALARVATSERWMPGHRVLAGVGFLLLMSNAVALNPLQALMPLAAVFRAAALFSLIYLTYVDLRRGASDAEGAEQAVATADPQPAVTL